MRHRNQHDTIMYLIQNCITYSLKLITPHKMYHITAPVRAFYLKILTYLELPFHQSLYCQCYVTFHRCIHPCNHNILLCLYPDQQVHIPYHPPFSLGSRHPHLELYELHILQLITCKSKFKNVAKTLIFEKNAAFSQSIHISKTFHQN